MTTIATTAAVTSVASVTTPAAAATLALADPDRVGHILFNASTAVLYVKYGEDASATDYTFKIAAGQGYESPAAPIYRGLITGIWASEDGACQVTQLH